MARKKKVTKKVEPKAELKEMPQYDDAPSPAPDRAILLDAVQQDSNDERMHKMMMGLAKGYSTRRLARELDVSPGTVRNYYNRLKAELDASPDSMTKSFLATALSQLKALSVLAITRAETADDGDAAKLIDSAGKLIQQQARLLVQFGLVQAFTPPPVDDGPGFSVVGRIGRESAMQLVLTMETNDDIADARASGRSYDPATIEISGVEALEDET